MNLFDDPEQMEVTPDKRPVLRDYQIELLERGRQAYVDGARRVIWQAPCGSGKTVIAAEQTRRALEKGMTVLHIVHRRRLVDQMIWALARLDIDAAPIMEGRPTFNAKVKCASRDTLLAMKRDGQPLPMANLLVKDEAHVAWNELVDDYKAIKFWTGYTASPVGVGGASLNPPWDGLVCCIKTSSLIAAGQLCPVKVYNPDAVGRRRKKGEKVKPVGDPIAHWRKYADGRPTVVFAGKVSDSKDIVERYLKAGVSAEHVDADTPEPEREAMFQRSKEGKTLVISNVGVLVEGVDLPWLECCQILRGCNSLVLWIQGPGRVMRPWEGKTHGIVLDHAGAAHEYGMPDADFVWVLGSEGDNKKKNKPNAKGLVLCPKCGHYFQARPACPECGHVMPKKKRPSLLSTIKNGDGLLTEFHGDGEALAVSREQLFRKCFFVARGCGLTMGAAAAMFSKQAGVPPWQAGLNVNLPTGSGWKTPAKEWRL